MHGGVPPQLGRLRGKIIGDGEREVAGGVWRAFDEAGITVDCQRQAGGSRQVAIDDFVDRGRHRFERLAVGVAGFCIRKAEADVEQRRQGGGRRSGSRGRRNSGGRFVRLRQVFQRQRYWFVRCWRWRGRIFVHGSFQQPMKAACKSMEGGAVQEGVDLRGIGSGIGAQQMGARIGTQRLIDFHGILTHASG